MDRVPDKPFDIWDGLAFAASVLIVLLYGQIWFAPLTGYGQASADPLKAVFYPAYMLAIALVLLRPGETLRILKRSPWLLALILLVIASNVWSIAPDKTLRRTLALVCTSLAGIALAARWSWPRFLEVLATAFAIMGVLSLMLAVLKPDWGRMTELFPGAWRGVWVEKNSLGSVMALAAVTQIAAAVLTPRRAMVWSGAAALSVFLVLMSTSKTSLVVLLLALAALSFMAVFKGGPLRAVVGGWVAVVGVAGAAVVLTLAWRIAFDLLGKDATLTGRTKVWSGILNQMPSHYSTGFGYGAVWDNESSFGPAMHVAREALFLPAHAHNGWLEVLLALGLPGVVLMALWLAETWMRSIWSAFTSPAGWFALPFTLIYSVNMLTESVTLNWHDLWWVMFVAVSSRLALGVDPDPAYRPSSRRAAGRRRLAVRPAPA